MTYDEAVKTQFKEFVKLFPSVSEDIIYRAMEWNASVGVYAPDLTEQDIIDYLEVI